MRKQTSSLWERLKICWSVLTLESYVYFGLGKDPIIWNEDGTYKKLKDKKFSAFTYIPYDLKFTAYGKETNLHDFIWRCIEKFAGKAKRGEY